VRNLRRDHGTHIHVHLHDQPINQPSAIHIQIRGMGGGSEVGVLEDTPGLS